MFKISLHIFGVDPVTLWTLNDDEFKVTGNKFGLTQIISHPIWRRRKNGHEFMLFALTWTPKLAWRIQPRVTIHVTTDDLDAVIMGLDESKTWMSCEAHYALYQKSSGTTHADPSSIEVAELYRNAFLNIERRRMIDHKRDSDSRPPSEPP
ncbi:hypothetical protein FPRO04_08032 [Fusarium proliferatum]|nr:hypothetical protein FPRO03_12898 [Fusarium proliferatum]KAG4275913.1 hypothetical protein FPRO04_08032 [Fusarium proliferatum]